MTDYLDVFSASYQRVTTRTIEGREFLEAFYRCFIGKSPVIAAKFAATDLERQRRLLGLSLNHMVYFSIDRRAGDELLRIARSHARDRLDIAPSLYEIWLDSLLEVVAEYDPDYDDEIGLAWRVLLAPGIAYMKAHY